jgi:hypothetical protein
MSLELPWADQGTVFHSFLDKKEGLRSISAVET